MTFFRKAVLALCACSFFCASLSAENSPSKDESALPQWVKDFRRTEIITFGSLPFVTMWVSVGYGLVTQGTFHNPLDKSTSNYTEDEQKDIIKIAAATSIALGLTDLIINIVTRNVKKTKSAAEEKTIRVIPYSQKVFDFSNYELNKNDTPESDELFPKNAEEYLIQGIENALF